MNTAAKDPTYWEERFTGEEERFLSHYVTNTHGPVFVLINLPEVVKGALFARYSRSSKSLRRLLLDEFSQDLNPKNRTSAISTRRAENLYNRVLNEYGDDSVAQLGGAHLACEQASNVLTKILEWHRLASYLEQSTRYIPYDSKLGSHYRYRRDPSILRSPWKNTYITCMDQTFTTYSDLISPVSKHLARVHPRLEGESENVHMRAVHAKALDVLRGLLPAASISNLGIYASGQTFETMLLRMRAHPLPEANSYATLMLEELRKVIPDFLQRVDRPDRGGAWSQYMMDTNDATKKLCTELFPTTSIDTAPYLRLVDYDSNGEDNILRAIIFEHSSLSEQEIDTHLTNLPSDTKAALMQTYVGNRENRRHRPGRAFEATNYKFEIVADYGSFRDLQRHRMLTIEWQPLSPIHGYEVPETLKEANLAQDYIQIMDAQKDLYYKLLDTLPTQASYAIGLGYKIRYAIRLNAREAMHLCELRSQPQGHISYRRVAQEMHRQIDEIAGHHLVAKAMQFVNYTGSELGRRDAEQRLEAKQL